MRTSNVAALVLLLSLLAGCEERPCRGETLFLTVDLAGETYAADELEVQVRIQVDTNVTTMSSTRLSRTPGGLEKIEIDFPNGYPQGKTVFFTILARQNDKLLGSVDDSVVLLHGCESKVVPLKPLVPPDMAMPPDLSTPDLTILDATIGDYTILPDATSADGT